MRLNEKNDFFKDNPIDARLCATAGLVHDLGHPPFGHNGEHALDRKMIEHGGFEGNAQTLRILTRLEKKGFPVGMEKKVMKHLNSLGKDRVGLNLTYRTLAACLKYDRTIPHRRDSTELLVKGYYAQEQDRVEQIKDAVDPDWRDLDQDFKTVECSIMDLADDIAYSTYDLEDSLKAGFLTPAQILASDEDLLKQVANKVGKSVGKPITPDDILSVFFEMFSGLAPERAGKAGRLADAIETYQRSLEISQSGYLRTDLTSQLVGEFINSVDVKVNTDHPALSRAYLKPKAKLKVETLKNYTFEATIFSSRLKVAEFRGGSVVDGIFDALAHEKGFLLMPDDVRELYEAHEDNASERSRIICDFIAGMTDRYALEFYGRLHSDSPQTIFKPI